MHYDVESDDYAPEPEADDTSKIMAGVEDQYTKKNRLDLEEE